MSNPQWRRVTEYIKSHQGCTSLDLQNLVPRITQHQRAVYEARHFHGQNIVNVPPDAGHKYHRFFWIEPALPGMEKTA